MNTNKIIDQLKKENEGLHKQIYNLCIEIDEIKEKLSFFIKKMNDHESDIVDTNTIVNECISRIDLVEGNLSHYI